MNDFERKIKDSKKEITESNINNPKELYQKATSKKINNKSIFNYTMVIRFAMILLMVATIITSSVAIYKNNQEKPPVIINQIINVIKGEEEATSEVVKFDNVNQIKKLVSEAGSDIVLSPGDENDLSESLGSPGESVSSPTVGLPGGTTSDREYQTNIQEENVDEADIVKVNGDYIYYIPYSSYSVYYDNPDYCKLYIFKAVNNTVELVKSIDYYSSKREVANNGEAIVTEHKLSKPQDMFYTKDYLVVRLYTKMYDKITFDQKTSTTNYKYYTEYVIYDTNTYEEVKNITLPGNYVSSRLIDNELYIVNNYSNIKTNNSYLPTIYLDRMPVVGVIDDIYYCPNFGKNVNSYVVIFKVTLDKEFNVDQLYVLSPYINNIYMTENAIYLLKKNSYDSETKNNIRVSCPKTKILIINIENDMFVNGMVEVEGNVNDKYWIDEYNGFLRVASTGTKYTYKLIDEKYTYDTKSEVFNYITIFNKNNDGKWMEVSSIKEGLGLPGETIRSARFEKNTATIVTFKQTDPLYYVDLTDHYNPKITSELKIEGFTVYQHPYKNNYVIGIGYDADANGRVTGYKVALFDIREKNNIKQVGDSIIFSYGEYSRLKVIDNPKELLLDLENGIFGFSIMRYENTTNRHQYYSEYYTIKIDLTKENPLYIFDTESIKTDNYKGVIDRMVFINNNYYLLATNQVKVYRLTSNQLGLLGTYKIN